MAFVQIIEFRTSDIERARQVNDEWWRATEGKRTVRRNCSPVITPTPATASLSCSSTHTSQRWRTPTCPKPRHQQSST
jgi:hypothetical protein